MKINSYFWHEIYKSEEWNMFFRLTYDMVIDLAYQSREISVDEEKVENEKIIHIFPRSEYPDSADLYEFIITIENFSKDIEDSPLGVTYTFENFKVVIREG